MSADQHTPAERAEDGLMTCSRHNKPGCEDCFCGCCGRDTRTADYNFCADCLTHCLNRGLPWDRTYYAQHGTNCPLEGIYPK